MVVGKPFKIDGVKKNVILPIIEIFACWSLYNINFTKNGKFASIFTNLFHCWLWSCCSWSVGPFTNSIYTCLPFSCHILKPLSPSLTRSLSLSLSRSSSIPPKNPTSTIMAMHTKKHVLALYTFVLFLDYNFALISAYRPREVRPPSPVRELIKSGPPPPAQGLTKSTPRKSRWASIKSSPPSLTESTPQTQELAFTGSNSKVKASIKSNPKVIRARITRYKKIQADAYRPTSPGNSPGMGHDVPPRG